MNVLCNWVVPCVVRGVIVCVCVLSLIYRSAVEKVKIV